MPNVTRLGRTLPELLVALVVSGILFALLSAAFIGHERLTAGATAIAELRANARQAQQILPAILSAANSSDFYALHDTLVDLEYTIGTAVTCQPSAPQRLLLAPDTVAAGQHFASWTHTPQPGDLAHVFDPGTQPGSTDDQSWTAVLAGLSTVPNACAGSALLDSLRDASHTAHVAALTWTGAPPALIPLGSVVRFTRRTRAFLYTSSGKPYLGVSDFDRSTARWSVVQPVSGPYASSPLTPGIRLHAVDSLGNNWPFGPLASITVEARAQSPTRLRIPGFAGGIRSESLSASVALRNR